MKKTFIIVAAAAIAALASCQKVDNKTEEVAYNNPVFTATLSPMTKATIDGVKVNFELGDAVRIAGNNSTDAYVGYTVTAINAGVATLTPSNASKNLGDPPYYAYSNEKTANANTNVTVKRITESVTQKYTEGTLSPEYIFLEAHSNTTTLEFNVTSPIYKISAQSAGQSISEIRVAVTCTPLEGDASVKTYKLSCDPAVSIDTAKDFYMAFDYKYALPTVEGVSSGTASVKSITFVNASGAECVKTLKGSASIPQLTAGTIQPISFTGLAFDEPAPTEWTKVMEVYTNVAPTANEAKTVYTFTYGDTGMLTCTYLDLTLRGSDTQYCKQTSKSDFVAGYPSLRALYTGDTFVVESSTGAAAGDSLKFEFGLIGSGQGFKDCKLEYLDGATWKKYSDIEITVEKTVLPITAKVKLEAATEKISFRFTVTSPDAITYDASKTRPGGWNSLTGLTTSTFATIYKK